MEHRVVDLSPRQHTVRRRACNLVVALTMIGLFASAATGQEADPASSPQGADPVASRRAPPVAPTD